MHPSMVQRGTGGPRRRSPLLLPLLVIPLALGCQAAPQLVVAVPNIYLSHASGVQHEVVQFYQFGYETNIESSLKNTWTNLTSLYNFPLFFPWLDRIEIPYGHERILKIGDSIPYVAEVVGKKLSGTAVVTAIEPERRLMMTLFSDTRGSLEFLLSGKDDCTRVSVTLITEMHDLSMVRSATQVEQELHTFLQQTLRNLKLYCEGKRLDEQEGGVAAPPPTQVCRDCLPFDVVKGVVVIDAPVEKVWDTAVRTGPFPHFFEEVEGVLPPARRNRLDRVGNGIPYKQKIGNRNFTGTAVVTRVEPYHALHLAMFTDFKGGVEFKFIPRGKGKTEFSFLSYLQVPAEYKGVPLDRKEVLKTLQEDMNRTLQEVKKRSEAEPESPQPAAG